MKRAPGVFIERTCEECRAPFSVPQSQLKRPNRGRFCSAACNGKSSGRRNGMANRQKAVEARRRVRQPVDHRLISLSSGETVKVDCDDYDWLNSGLWSKSHYGYAVGYLNAEHMFMHRAIMLRHYPEDPADGRRVDHINRDTLDNRKNNLRFATHQQNMVNSPSRRGAASAYKGVGIEPRYTVRKWTARIGCNGTTFLLGSYATEQEAAVAYDCAAIQLFGEYAWLNIIGRDGDV